MDLKSKGIAWVGNIYQRFETMCQEVDSIVNQNSVKYVENRVQTVGESMKKFCDVVQDIVPPILDTSTVKYVENQVQTVGESMKKFSDVVQDIVPPIVDTVRCEAQAVAIKGNAVGGPYIKSMIGIVEGIGHVDPVKQSSIEPRDFDAVKNQLSNTNMFTRHHPINQPVTAPLMESLFESDPGNINDVLANDLSKSDSGKMDYVSTNKTSDLSAEENTVVEESNIPEALGLIAPEEKESLHSSISSEFIDSENEISCVSVEEEESFHVSVSGEFIDSNQENACNCVPEVSPAISVHEEKLKSLQKVETACYSPADDSYSVSDSSAVVTPLERVSLDASSSGSIFTEPHTLHENSFNDILTQESCSDPGSVPVHDSDSSIGLLSSVSAPVAFMDREVAETGSGFSNDVLSSKAAGFSNYSSYICDDISDPGMETIDLFDKVKLDESCVIVNNSMLYEVSRKIHKPRSYKKIIQDAFSSKKRLSKEYEQLAILYGDIDFDSSQDTAPGQWQTSEIVASDPASEMRHTLYSEWELL